VSIGGQSAGGRETAGPRPCAVRGTRCRCAALALAAICAGAPAAPALARSTARRRAHAAHALKASDTAHLHFVSASGSLLHEVGTATGTIPGSMKVRFSLGTTMKGSFTIYTKAGSISGHGEATPHGSGVIESFSGSIVVTAGTGRYKHAHGHANLYGTFNRNSYALVVQTAGTLSY
jgi:hypothetical protein